MLSLSLLSSCLFSNIFFVPSVQENHFDVVFNDDIWECYVLVFSEDIYSTHVFTFFILPPISLAVSSLTVVIVTIVNVSVLVKEQTLSCRFCLIP